MKQRSTKTELLDEENIPQQDLYRNLYELDIINRKLGGHAVTIKGLERLNLNQTKTYRILDIGCGGGDTLKAIANWGLKNNYNLELVGVDLKPGCINYAANFCKDYSNISFVESDYKLLPQSNATFDVIVTSLFCHHLNNTELTALFSWAVQHTKVAFIMNDLHRNVFAYYSISLLTTLFSKSYLVKNDAKLSVLRGFKKYELETLLSACKLKISTALITLNWCWAFRWLLIIKANE